MPGLSQIKRPQKGEDVCELWKIVDAVVVFANAIIGNFSVVQGNTTAPPLQISPGNAVLTLPAAAAGGTGGGGLGPVVFAGTASGEVAYFVVNASPVAYSNFPAGYTLANPS